MLRAFSAGITLVAILEATASAQLVPDPVGTGVPVPSFYFRSLARSPWAGTPTSRDWDRAYWAIRYEQEKSVLTTMTKQEYIDAMVALTRPERPRTVQPVEKLPLPTKVERPAPGRNEYYPLPAPVRKK